ncbi:hypothetical protein KAT24_01575 [Candidatus Pacearchaeota archaeon]|nr:hypothetical protein [Candidatus Pacearchaeota archaeon]
MRKKVLIVSLMFLIFCAYLAVAQDATVSEKGYDCLETKVAGKCSSLSPEERIFSLLAIDRCKSEVVADAKDDECWPASGCKIKTTAQAILALNSVGTSTTKAENWLLSQEISPPNVDWLLQIESTSPTSCDISYLGKPPYTISINADKKISSNAGACLKIYDEYWLRISPTCYNEEFEISCDETFFTNLLYKKQGSDVIYVLKGTNSASAGGVTKENVNSFCFKQGASCNYEGSLWAALVLKFKGHDTSSYLPYLITMTDENSEFIPESFLYSLTGSFKEELLLKQKESKWWSESGDKFYDTAVALYSLQKEEPQEKTDAKDWLEEVQGDDGCWQNNIRNTAFILFSAWPKKIISPDETKPDCEDEDYYCMTSAACQESGGDVLVNYGGCGINVCCSVESLLESCLLQGGEICSSGELCSGETVAAADTEKCCVSGECVEIEDDGGEEKSECERYGGECKSFCSSDEESSSYDCPSFDVCCFDKSKKTYTGIIIFGILIILTVLGIIFRKKLRKYWLKIKSKFGKSKPGSRRGPRGFPPGPSSSIARRTTPRRILPPGQRPVRRYTPRQKPKGEMDDVLKKLKEMGK